MHFLDKEWQDTEKEFVATANGCWTDKKFRRRYCLTPKGVEQWSVHAIASGASTESIGFQSPALVPTTVALSFVPNSLRYFRCEKTGTVCVTNRYNEKHNIDSGVISIRTVKIDKIRTLFRNIIRRQKKKKEIHIRRTTFLNSLI